MLEFTPASKHTDIGIAIEFLTRAAKRRCTAFVLSDFYSQKDFQQQLRICNQKHDVVAIQVYDIMAKNLPNVGLLKVIDGETGHESYIDTSSSKLRQAHTAYWQQKENALKQTFVKCNVDWISVATNEDFVRNLMLLFAKRG